MEHVCSYEGEWLDGQKHGFGAERMAPPLSTVYQGEWRYGRKEGHGKIITPENEVTLDQH